MINFLRILSDILSFYFMIRFCSKYLQRKENQNQNQNQNQLFGSYHRNNNDKRNKNETQNMKINERNPYYNENLNPNLEKNEMTNVAEEDYGDLDESSDLFFNEERSSAEVTSSCSFQFLPYSINYDTLSVLSKHSKANTNNDADMEDER